MLLDEQVLKQDDLRNYACAWVQIGIESSDSTITLEIRSLYMLETRSLYICMHDELQLRYTARNDPCSHLICLLRFLDVIIEGTELKYSSFTQNTITD